MRTSIAFAVAAVAAGLGLPLVAGATVPIGIDTPLELRTYSATVRYEDLNLQTRQGAGALYTRLSKAASNVCGGLTDEPYLTLTHSYSVCRTKALSKAVREVNRPLLTQVFDQHHARNEQLGTAQTATAVHAPHA